MVSQLKVVGIGFVIIFGLYFFGRQDWLRAISQYGFLVSFALLTVLVLNLNLGVVRAGEINGARRILMVAGKQIHIYEFNESRIIDPESNYLKDFDGYVICDDYSGYDKLRKNKDNIKLSYLFRNIIWKSFIHPLRI